MPTPVAHAHIPVLAPHSLEPDDRVLLPANCLSLAGADTQTLSTPSWAVHSMAEGAKAERGRGWSLGCSALPVSRLASSWPHGLQTKSSSPTRLGLELSNKGLGNSCLTHTQYPRQLYTPESRVNQEGRVFPPRKDARGGRTKTKGDVYRGE